MVAGVYNSYKQGPRSYFESGGVDKWLKMMGVKTLLSLKLFIIFQKAVKP